MNSMMSRQSTYSQSKPITLQGVDYPSLAAAARALGIQQETLTSRLKRAKPGEDVTKRLPYPGKTIEVNGITYRSVREAAEKLGLNYGSFVQKIKITKPGEDVTKRKTIIKQIVKVDGVEYISFADAARRLGVDPSTLHLRKKRAIKAGTDPRDLTLVVKKRDYAGFLVKIGDTIYPSLSAVARAFGHPMYLIWQRYKKGDRGPDLVRGVKQPRFSAVDVSEKNVVGQP